jgi:hypothetical protein
MQLRARASPSQPPRTDEWACLASTTTVRRSGKPHLPRRGGVAAAVTPNESRKSEVLRILRRSHIPLDDDQIAQAAQMNRHYVNAIRRQLAADRVIIRSQGDAGKLVNMAAEWRRGHRIVHSLLDDTQFLEYVYAVLPAWGMHRMGPQSAKVGDFAPIVAALKERWRRWNNCGRSYHLAQHAGRQQCRSNRLGCHRTGQSKHVADPDRRGDQVSPPPSA